VPPWSHDSCQPGCVFTPRATLEAAAAQFQSGCSWTWKKSTSSSYSRPRSGVAAVWMQRGVNKNTPGLWHSNWNEQTNQSQSSWLRRGKQMCTGGQQEGGPPRWILTREINCGERRRKRRMQEEGMEMKRGETGTWRPAGRAERKELEENIGKELTAWLEAAEIITWRGGKSKSNLKNREPEDREDEERRVEDAEHRKKNRKMTKEDKRSQTTETRRDNETVAPLFPAAPRTSPISVGHRRQSGKTNGINY